jgi:hypothetical protein
MKEPTPEGIEARDQFAKEWLDMRNAITPELLLQAAQQYFDTAALMGAEGWDGSTQLEKDGRINQDLNN